MNLLALLPEIILSIGIILSMMMDAFLTKYNKFIPHFCIIVLLACIATQTQISTQVAFNGMFLLDNLAINSKIITYILTIFIFGYVKDVENPVFYSLAMFALLGMLTMISAYNLLILYIGLEVFSLSVVGMIALPKTDTSLEAGIKFFILSAVASGVLLYGISFIYGASNGYLQLDTITASMIQGTNGIMVLGGLLVFCGLFYKLGLIPFHAWIPDTYQGSSWNVTAFIATVTKVATLVFVLRFLINTLILLNQYWISAFLIVGCLSLLAGNLLAMMQNNIRRMLAYSTIANMGFMVLGFTDLTAVGISSIIFYIIVYSITTLGIFGVLLRFNVETIDDIKGFSKKYPIHAFCLLILMLSIAGIPPFIGFYAKLKILVSLVAVNNISIAVFAVISSLIGVFYYIKIIKSMYFDEPNKDLAYTASYLANTLLFINIVVLIYVSILPAMLIDYGYSWIV